MLLQAWGAKGVARSALCPDTLMDWDVCEGMQDSHGMPRVLVLNLRGQTSQPTVLGFYETVHNAIEILVVCAV